MSDESARQARREALRRSMRTRRAGLQPAALKAAGDRLAGHLHALLAPYARIAGYLAIGGEIPVDAALADCRARGALTALPVLQAAQRMRFVAFEQGTPLTARRFGLLEPADGDTVPPLELDAVLLPLLAFDHRGNRLGMGGGYYDRCFEQLAPRRAAGLPTPRLIGVAHAFQQVERLPAEAWDVPLDQVVSEEGVVPARNSR